VSIHLPPHLQRHLTALLATSEEPLEFVRLERGEDGNRLLAAAATARLSDDRSRILVLSAAHQIEEQFVIWDETGFDTRIRRSTAPGNERVTLAPLETVRSRDAYWQDAYWNLLVVDDFLPGMPGTANAHVMRVLRRVVPTIWIKDGGCADRYARSGGIAEEPTLTAYERELERLRSGERDWFTARPAPRTRPSALAAVTS
jgi:hypothetical protein